MTRGRVSELFTTQKVKSMYILLIHKNVCMCALKMCTVSYVYIYIYIHMSYPQGRGCGPTESTQHTQDGAQANLMVEQGKIACSWMVVIFKTGPALLL